MERIVYNPWLLALLWQRVVYRHELLGQRPLSEEARRRLVWEGGRAAQLLVQDVVQTRQLMARERWPYDCAWASFEPALYRLLALFCPAALVMQGGPGASQVGAPFGCELALLAALDPRSEQAQRRVVYDALQRHVARHYARDAHTEQQCRLPLLLNMKHAVEEQVGPQGLDARLCYDAEMAHSLMCCFFLDACASDVDAERVALQFRRGGGDDDAQTLYDEGALLQALHCVARHSLLQQVQRHAVQQHPSMVRDDDNARYKAAGGERRDVLCVDAEDDALMGGSSERVEQTRWLSLRNHLHCYEYVVHRFQFDYALQCQHARDCAICQQPDLVERRARHCTIQHYLEHDAALAHFYAVALDNGAQSQLQRERRASQAALLQEVALRPVTSPSAWLYRVLGELAVLFDASCIVHRFDEYGGSARGRLTHDAQLRLLPTLDLVRLMRDAHDRLRDRPLDALTETVLLSEQDPRAAPHTRNEAVQRLAVQCVFIDTLLHCMARQQVELERYERSLSRELVLCSQESTRRLHSALQSELVAIAYQLYRAELRRVLNSNHGQ